MSSLLETLGKYSFMLPRLFAEQKSSQLYNRQKTSHTAPFRRTEKFANIEESRTGRRSMYLR